MKSNILKLTSMCVAAICMTQVSVAYGDVELRSRLIKPLEGFERWNNDDPRIDYSCRTIDHVKYRPGDYGGTFYENDLGNCVDGKVTFKFYGEKFIIRSYVNPDTSGYHIMINGVDMGSITTQDKQSKSLVTYVSPKLSTNMEHNVELTVLDKSVAGGDSSRIGLDSIDVFNGTVRLLDSSKEPYEGWKRWNGDDLRIEYDCGVINHVKYRPGDYDGTFYRNDLANCSSGKVKFTFEGSKFFIRSYINNDTSGYNVNIDGNDLGDVTTCYGQTRSAVTYISPELTEGEHTAELTVLDRGSNRIGLDSIDIFGRNCCKVCISSKACEDSCIPEDHECTLPPGCACNDTGF